MVQITLSFPNLIPSFLNPNISIIQFMFLLLFIAGSVLTLFIYLKAFTRQTKTELSEPSTRIIDHKSFSKFYAIINLIGLLFLSIALVRIYTPQIKEYPLIYLEKSSRISSSINNFFFFPNSDKNGQSNTNLLHNFSFDSKAKIQGLGDKPNQILTKKAVFLNPSNQIMDIEKLQSRKQISIVHVDKSEIFYKEFGTVMAQKSEDFWIVRMDKINNKLLIDYSSKKNKRRNGKLWDRIAVSLIAKLRQEHNISSSSWLNFLFGMSENDAKKKQKVTIFILWTPPNKYIVERQFYELIYSIQSHSVNCRVVIATESNMISKSTQKFGLNHLFTEYSLKTEILEDGLAINKGFRNVYAKGIEQNLDQLLNEEEKVRFDQAIEQAQEEQEVDRKTGSRLKDINKVGKVDQKQLVLIEKKVKNILWRKNLEHDIISAVLALSDNSWNNKWINSSEITTVQYRKLSVDGKSEILKKLVEEKILIQDKQNVRFYDESVFKVVKRMYEEVYQVISIDANTKNVDLKKKRSWIFKILYSHLNQ